MNPSWVPILCYHRVCPEKEFGKHRSLCVTPQQFRSQLGLLKTLGYTAHSMQNVAAYFRMQKNIPSKSVVLTFDDGYEDNYTHAFPILKEFGMTANIFLVTDQIGGVNAWDGLEDRLMNENQIKEMRDAGIVFGSHTASHLDMSRADSSKIRAELKKSRDKLEEITWRKDIPFCYPYSRFNDESKRLVKEAGYLCALSVDSGPLEQSRDLFDLRRVQIFPSTSLFGFWKKIQPWYPRWMKLQREFKR